MDKRVNHLMRRFCDEQMGALVVAETTVQLAAQAFAGRGVPFHVALRLLLGVK